MRIATSILSGSGSLSLACSLLIGLSVGFFFLLPLLPLLANLFEFFGCSLLSVRLHRNVSVQVVQCTIGFFTAIPSTLVHALNLLVSSSRSFVLLRTWNGNEGVNLVWSCLRWRRGRVLRVNWMAGGQRRTTVLRVTSPVWSRLRIHAATWVRVTVCHVWVRRVGGMLPIRSVSWARRGDGRIVLLLRHTSSAGAAGRMV